MPFKTIVGKFNENACSTENQAAQKNPKVHVIGSNIMLFNEIHVGFFKYFDIFVNRALIC